MKNSSKIWLLIFLIGSLKMSAALPDWTVKAADFQFNMSVLVRLKTNGVFDNAPQNMIAAFVGSELRGVAQPIFAGAAAYFFITVFSNSYAGETLTFKTYIAADDKIYTMSESQVFKHNALAGKFDQPLLFSFCRSYAATYSTINPTCFGNSNGTIFSNVAGIAPPYTYLWSNGKTTRDINLLAAGTYTQTVTDAGGCSVVNSTTLTQPPVINFAVNFTASPPGFKANFTTSGGTPGYLYNRTGMTTTDYRVATDPIFSNLAANTSFIFKVKDANGCQKSVIKKTPATQQQQQMLVGAANRSFFENEKLEAGSSQLGMLVLPNPISDLLNVSLISSGETAGELLLIDLFGRLVFSKKVNFEEEILLSIPLENLQKGWYNLVFREKSGWTLAEKLAKI